MGILEDISQLLQKGKSKKVKELVQQAIDEGIDAKVILDEGLLAGMNAVGDQFHSGRTSDGSRPLLPTKSRKTEHPLSQPQRGGSETTRIALLCD